MDVVVRPAVRPLTGGFSLPGDKSIAHRVVLISALAEGTSEITDLPQSADVLRSVACIQALGIDVTPKGVHSLVTGRGLRGLRKPDDILDAGNSGTTARLLSGLLAGQTFDASITGDESLRRRPMRRIIEPLSLMGAQIEASHPGFTAPLSIQGRSPLKALTYELPVASAQVKSAILLAGLYADGTTTVLERRRTRDHTERLLGLREKSANGVRSVSIQGGTVLPPLRLRIPGDISSAAYLIAAALLVRRSEITVRHAGLNPTRSRILDVLREMGARIRVSPKENEHAEPAGDIEVSSSELSGRLSLRGDDIPLLIDEIPILAVIAAASGMSLEVRGAEELRVKESDRIALLALNLRAMGVDVEEYSDGFAFEGKKKLFGARVQTGGDHRIAMAFAVAGLVAEGETVITDAESNNVSFPGFWETLLPFSGP